MTTSSTTVTTFSLAQTFFIDPGVVANAPTISLTSVDLYFKSKPVWTGNASGINFPGVTLYVCEVTTNGTDEVPNTNKVIYNSYARVEYNAITISTDASTPVNFEFQAPINVDTGKSYAILIKYDGNEAFDLWKSQEGKKLVGTTNTGAGPAGKYIGKYFEYSAAANTQGTVGLYTNWKPLSTTDLKFSVYCAKYIPDTYANTSTVDPFTGDTVTSIVAERSYLLYKKPYEFIVYNRLNSNNTANVIGGELVWQNNVIQPTTVSVKSGSNTITSQNTNFTTLYGNSTDDKYIVVYSGTQKNIRKISSIVSNNSITLEVPMSFTNAFSTFSKVVAGKIDLVSKTLAFGKSENAIALDESNANSSLRFSNAVVEALTISAGGTGYSNSDWIVVYNGGANSTSPAYSNAYANLSTNSTGGITTVTISNKGSGFFTTPTLAIKVNSGASNSTGTGATITPTIGSTLLTEMSNVIFANCEIINVPVNQVMVAAVDVESPTGTSYHVKKHYLYYSVPDGIKGVDIILPGTGYSNSDTVSFSGGTGGIAKIVTDSAGAIVTVTVTAPGSGYYSNTAVATVSTSGGSGANLSPIVGTSRYTVNSGESVSNVDFFDTYILSTDSQMPLILSRSNEVLQTNTTITTETGRTVNTNISSVVEMVITSNNVYSTADVLSSEADVFFQKYAINNNYLNENTGNGLAISKHISKTVSFGTGMLAEDARVYVDVYRPANTRVKVFARIESSADSDAFVDKDWTLLELKSNNSGSYSASKNYKDIIEFEYGFPLYPNTATTLSGSVTTTLNSSNLIGSNTTFTSNVNVNDLIRVYSPLFPNTNYQVAVVNSVVNNTLITIQNPISNNSMVGAGFKIDTITYKHQAFNSIQTSNVVTYYDSNMGKQRGYNTFAVKLVFQSDNDLDVPFVDSIRYIGVTA